MSYKLRQAQKELDEYLQQNPHLVSFQNHLDEALNKAGDDPQARFKVFNLYLQDNLLELKTELIMLKMGLDEVLRKKDTEKA